jgi:hypothetical protein
MNSIGVKPEVNSSAAPQASRPGGQRVGEPVAGGAVADLVVVLQVGDQSRAGDAGGVDRGAVAAPPERGPGALVQEPAGEHVREPVEARLGEVAVVALGLAGEHGVQAVVDVVGPLGVEAVAAALPGGDHPRVVEVGLGDQ